MEVRFTIESFLSSTYKENREFENIALTLYYVYFKIIYLNQILNNSIIGKKSVWNMIGDRRINMYKPIFFHGRFKLKVG